MGVKVGQRQFLSVCKQVRTDLADHLLGHMDHHLVVSQTGDRSGKVHQAHKRDHADQPRYIAGQDIIIDHRL